MLLIRKRRQILYLLRKCELVLRLFYPHRGQLMSFWAREFGFEVYSYNCCRSERASLKRARFKRVSKAGNKIRTAIQNLNLARAAMHVG